MVRNQLSYLDVRFQIECDGLPLPTRRVGLDVSDVLLLAGQASCLLSPRCHDELSFGLLDVPELDSSVFDTPVLRTTPFLINASLAVTYLSKSVFEHRVSESRGSEWEEKPARSNFDLRPSEVDNQN
ncbi:hypothetical protein Tco_0064969 [Tanacetum coccineum]